MKKYIILISLLLLASCSTTETPKDIRVQYPSGDTIYEYVTEIQYRDNTPNELIDDSEFYQNK